MTDQDKHPLDEAAENLDQCNIQGIQALAHVGDGLRSAASELRDIGTRLSALEQQAQDLAKGRELERVDVTPAGNSAPDPAPSVPELERWSPDYASLWDSEWRRADEHLWRFKHSSSTEIDSRHRFLQQVGTLAEAAYVHYADQLAPLLDRLREAERERDELHQRIEEIARPVLGDEVVDSKTPRDELLTGIGGTLARIVRSARRYGFNRSKESLGDWFDRAVEPTYWSLRDIADITGLMAWVGSQSVVDSVAALAAERDALKARVEGLAAERQRAEKAEQLLSAWRDNARVIESELGIDEPDGMTLGHAKAITAERDELKKRVKGLTMESVANVIEQQDTYKEMLKLTVDLEAERDLLKARVSQLEAIAVADLSDEELIRLHEGLVLWHAKTRKEQEGSLALCRAVLAAAQEKGLPEGAVRWVQRTDLFIRDGDLCVRTAGGGLFRLRCGVGLPDGAACVLHCALIPEKGGDDGE